ncbi:MAG TPA: hypothetical protein VMH35_20440 [Streptosporangiaceae bacterium]|nr:hypothetical protein [Streptosporangiaceae bacterium]
MGEPRTGEVAVDVLVNGVQGGAEFGWGWGLVGGQQWAEQPIVQFGVEDRGLVMALNDLGRSCSLIFPTGGGG